MKITIAPFLVLAFAFTSSAKEATGQEMLERPISLSVEKAKLKTVLREIQQRAEIKFVFSSVIIDANRKISFAVTDKKVGELLNQIFVPLNISYRVIDDQIILFDGSAVSADLRGIPVHGRITDDAGNPLSGATVQVKGTRISVVTDQKGVFVLDDVDPAATLIISYVGHVNREIVVNNQTEINTILQETTSSLNQVIVIGYGTARKRDIVGSLDIINTKEAGATISTNPSQLLIGKSAGVQVVQANGIPGADAQIIVRGTGSFTGVDPLYVIDGIQADKNLFNAISGQDIENITILKDASSTAIYGSAAANGVVIITTRKGKSGPPKISFTTQWGVSKAWKQLDLLNASQYVDLLKDFAGTGNLPLPAKFNGPTVLVDSNNWQSQIFRQAPVSENDISVSGGSEKVNYNFSVGYVNQQAIVKDLTNRRLNVRLGLEETLGRFHLGQSLAIRYTNTTGANVAGGGGPYANIGDAIGYAPYKPVKDPSVPGGYSIVSNIEDFSNVANPLQSVNLTHSKSVEFVFFPQVYAEVNLIRGLKFRSQFSAEIGGGKNTVYQEPFTGSNYLAQIRYGLLGYKDNSLYTLENYFSYNKTFGRHSIAATIGNSYLDPGKSANVQGTGTNIANDNIQNISVAQTLAVSGVGYGYARSAVISYFGRLVYSYDDKYILSGSLRRDGASNFGVNNQFGYFPGVGFAWRFSEEEFMKRLSVFTDGKLRIGWGRTGNNNIPTTGITSVLTFSGNPNGNLVYSLGPGEAYIPGTTIASLANPDIKWETTNQTDIGLDLGFLNRINLTADWYDRKSSGLLVSIPLPASVGAGLTGVKPIKYQNAANAENTGIELSLSYHNDPNRPINFNISGNIGYNKNNVISLGSQFTAPIQAGSIQQLSTFTITKAGSPIGSFYGYELDHVAKDQAEIDALNVAAAHKTGNPGALYQVGLKPGDFIFKDINGSGTVSDSDQAVLGNPIPKFVYGFSAGVTYKNFDLNLVFSGVAGLKLLNSMKFITSNESTGHNATTAILNRWKKPGDVAALPRAGQNVTANGNLRASDWWLENGDYLRLRNITLGYTIPKRVLNNIGGHVFARIRIYIAAQNLLTFTKYSGYDPEISTQWQQTPPYIFSRGIDDGQLPQPRTLLAGLQLGF